MLNTSDNNLTINQYEVLRSDDNGSDLLIPLFTRPKSMIHGTDFSGNNPYGYYIRYAKLRITAVFSTGHGDETVEKYVDVYQVPVSQILRPYGANREALKTLMSSLPPDPVDLPTPTISVLFLMAHGRQLLIR